MPESQFTSLLTALRPHFDFKALPLTIESRGIPRGQVL